MGQKTDVSPVRGDRIWMSARRFDDTRGVQGRGPPERKHLLVMKVVRTDTILQ
jgi:hypothetical protein